jgi:phospholipase/carboxylesterase
VIKESLVKLETVQVETGPQPQASVIWLHGLGADAHDFEPIVPELVRPGERALRFVFPHAPVRPVTLNGGYPMRSWYDIIGIDRASRQDESGVRASDQAVRELIGRENERGTPASRIVLAGFSQGGAMALFTATRYSERLAGIIALSSYFVLANTFTAERSEANARTPIFMAHGTDDPVVDPGLGAESKRLLEAGGHPVEWHTYPMGHTVSAEEVAAIAAWLRKTLP